MSTTRTLAVLLAGGMAASGLAAAPVSAARPATAHTPITAAAPAAVPAKATLTLTPSSTNRGGIVTVSGTGFAPKETVNLSVSGTTTVTATATADAQGALPATGLSVPYTLARGSYTVTATGATSKRTATAPLTIAALGPTISLSAAMAAPGSTETITGKGFGRQEQVTLALNGAALMTSPTAITTTNGAFTASITLPQSLLNGANTLSAIGNQSRVDAVAALTGQLARTTQFYLAGGQNQYNQHSTVSLLNTNAQPASVKMVFYFDNGATETRTTTVPATSTKAVPVIGLNLPAGTFGLQIRADRAVSAELTVNRVAGRVGQDSGALLGASGLATRWYLAAGSTTGTSQERVSILNPDPNVSTRVQLQLVRPASLKAVAQPSKTVVVTVPAHTNSVVNVNTLLPGSDVSVIANSDHPVLVERTLTFGPGSAGLTTRTGATTAATSWIFADATSANGVRTTLTALNPGDVSARVTASLFGPTGNSLGSKTVYAPARSRVNIPLTTRAATGGVGVVVTSDQAVVVERSETTGAPDAARSGSTVVGRNGGGVRWTFPAGDTRANGGRNEVFVLFNPTQTTLPITATFYQTTGQVTTRQYNVAPDAHYVIPVNPLGLTELHGTVLQSGNGFGFIAEQGISTGNGSVLSSTQGLAQ